MSTNQPPQELRIHIDEDEMTKSSTHTNYNIAGNQTSSPTAEGVSPKPEPEANGNPYIVQPSSTGVQLRIPPKVYLVPKPFKKIKHVIIASYLSILCCLVTGIYANQYALDAKRYKDLGLRGEARSLAKQSVCCIYTSVILGVILFIVFGTVFGVTYSLKNN